MGSCAYFLKAEFKSPAVAKKAATKMKKLFVELRGAYDFWQASRSNDSPEEFWKKFGDAYPLSSDYLKSINGVWGGDFNNGLSGKMDFGQDSHNDTLVDGSVVGWYDQDVWHFAEWGFMCRHLEKSYGAIKAVCGDEEGGVGSLDSLMLHDYEQIVKDLLTDKNLHPLLLGKNADLDGMIDRMGKK